MASWSAVEVEAEIQAYSVKFGMDAAEIAQVVRRELELLLSRGHEMDYVSEAFVRVGNRLSVQAAVEVLKKAAAK